MGGHKEDQRRGKHKYDSRVRKDRWVRYILRSIYDFWKPEVRFHEEANEDMLNVVALLTPKAEGW